MNFRIVPMLSCLLILGGCAIGQSALDIPAPASRTAKPFIGKEVVVVSVKDRRNFEVSPQTPDIPSLDPDEANQGDAVKARSVGRKRNSFGKALGSLVLKEGQTIETLTAQSIRQAFAEQGYRVLDRKEQATRNTVFVDATIGKFWSWMNPGFMQLTLSTEIETSLLIKSEGKGSTKTVHIKASDGFQTGMEENWASVIAKALRAYVDELKSKLE